MDTASRFATLARQGLPFYEYAGSSARSPWQRCGMTPLLINCSGSGPTTTVPWTWLNWREGVFRCLGSVRARARTSPLSFAAPASPPLSVALPHPLPFVANASPPTAALPSLLFTGKFTPPFAAPSSPPFAGKLTPPSAALPSPPSVSMASPPSVSMASRRSWLTQAQCQLLVSALQSQPLKSAMLCLRLQSAP